MNLITIKGRLTRDPELRQTNNGATVCNLSVAVDREYSKAENKVTDFFDVVFWNQTAEFISKYFSKGREILLYGEMQSRKYDDRDGNKRTAWEVIGRHVEFCGSKADNAGFDAPSSNTATSEKKYSKPTALGVDVEKDEDEENEDLPF